VLQRGLHQAIQAKIVPILHLQHLCKLSAGSMHPALDRAHRHSTERRRILVRLLSFSHQEESFALL
jgi:hypothetical protein